MFRPTQRVGSVLRHSLCSAVAEMKDRASKQGRSRQPTPEKCLISTLMPCPFPIATERLCLESAALTQWESRKRLAMRMRCEDKLWQVTWSWQCTTYNERRGHVVLRSWNFMTVAVVTQNVCQLSSLWNNWQLIHHRILGLLNLFLPSSVWDGLCWIHTRVIYSSEWCSNLSTEELTIAMTPVWWFWRYGLKQLL